MSFKTKLKNGIQTLASFSKEEKIIPILKPISENKIFENKVALITGGSGGIGFSVAKNLISKGCKVIIAGTNENKLINAVEKLEGGILQKLLLSM